MKRPHLFEIFHEVALVEVTKNVPVPKGSVSFLDGHKAKLRKNCKHIEYLVGNGVKVRDTVIYSGSDKMGKRIGIEAVTKSPLIAPSGALLSRGQLFEGTEADRREIVTENSIGYSSFETPEDGLCEAYKAVKLASSKDMYPDFGRKLQIRDPKMRIYPFVSKNRASMGVFLYTYLGAGFQAQLEKPWLCFLLQRLWSTELSQAKRCDLGVTRRPHCLARWSHFDFSTPGSLRIFVRTFTTFIIRLKSSLLTPSRTAMA